MTKQQRAFLADLGELTRKHKIIIGGCGCCGSPHLTSVDTISAEGRYIFNRAYAGEVVFIEPGDYYWKANQEDSK